ncbi:MAG: 5'-methylthioadenosine/adenosylhomocysteine nucleosidase [Candidatus Brocadiia bacterium]
MSQPRVRRLALVLLLLCAGVGAGEREEPLTAVLGAMGSEVRLLLDELEDREEHVVEGLPFWTGRLRGRPVVVARTGVGKVNAAVVATLLYVRFAPNEVLFTGIAGGLDPELAPGDIVIAEKTVQHDFGTLTADGFRRRGARNPLFPERNPTFIPADRRLLGAALAAKDAVDFEPVRLADGQRTPRVARGIVATGDAFIALRAKKQELRRELGAHAVEMEGGAVAQVCWQWKVPCLVIRSLSDLADESAVADSRRFRHVAATNSARLVAAICQRLTRTPREAP